MTSQIESYVTRDTHRQKCMPNNATWGIVTSVNAGDGCAKPVGGLIPAPERLVHSVPDNHLR